MSSIDFILSKIDNKFFNYIISNTLSFKYLIFEKFMLKFKRLTYVQKKMIQKLRYIFQHIIAVLYYYPKLYQVFSSKNFVIMNY